MLSRFYFFILLNCICVSAFAQSGFDNFSVSDDGKKIAWSDSHYNILLGETDSLLESYSYQPINTKMISNKCILSGNGKQIYSCNGGTVKIFDIGNDSLINEKTICKQEMYTGVFDVTSDGNYMVLGHAEKREAKCSPGNQRMLLIKKENDNYSVLDTIGSKKDCNMVTLASVGKDGIIAWQDLQFTLPNISHNRLAIGNDKNGTAEIFLNLPPNHGKIFYFLSSNGSNLFFLSVDTVKNFPNGFYYCKKTGDGFSSPQLLNFLPNQFYLAGSFAISPDGNKICWIENDEIENQYGYRNESVHTCKFENGNWTAPEKLFDIPNEFMGINNGYHRLVISDSTIFCLGGDQHLLLYSNFEQSGKLYGLDLNYHYEKITNYGNNIFSRLDILEPVEGGKLIHLSFPIKNTGTEMLNFKVQNSFYDQYKMQKTVQLEKGHWASINVDMTSEWNEEGFSTENISLAPGDSTVINYWTKFQYCKQIVNATFYAGNKAIIISAQAGKVELIKFRTATGELQYRNGKPTEELSKTNSGGWQFIRWFENGDTCMNVYFDKNLKKSGEWKFYSSTGKLMYEEDFQKNGKIVSSNTFYESGNKKSQITKMNSCAIGYSYSWYENGNIKSKAKFKSCRVADVYYPGCGISSYKTTTAKYYYEYYAGGQKKIEVFHKRNGNKKGTWNFLDENGNVLVSQHYSRSNQDENLNTFSNLPVLHYSNEQPHYDRYGGF